MITPGHDVLDSIAVGAPWAPRAGVCPQTPRSPDFDSDSTVVDAPDPALARQIAEVLEAAVPHPWIGRQLFGLFRRAGLADVRVMPHAICLPGAAGFAAYQQLNRGTIDRAVQAGQVSAGEAETFFVVNLGFIATGSKPQRQGEQGRDRGFR